MPIDISDLIDPVHTAVVLNECQVGILGSESSLPAIAEETRWIIPNAARLVQAARAVGAPVLHAVATRREDGRGGLVSPMMRRRVRTDSSLSPEEYSAPVPEIGTADSDFVVGRFGGMGGFSASGAVSILRSLGVRTVVLGGVTLNAGVVSMLVYAIDAGFDAVVVSDASAGFPRSYGEDVLTFTVRPFAPIATTDEILAIWGRPASG